MVVVIYECFSYLLSERSLDPFYGTIYSFGDDLLFITTYIITTYIITTTLLEWESANVFMYFFFFKFRNFKITNRSSAIMSRIRYESVRLYCLSIST